MIKFNKKSQKILLIFLPILLIIAVVAIIISNNNRRINDMSNVPETNYTLRKVYLNSSKDTLVPLTIKYQSKDNLGEELLFVVNLLKENSGISNQTFTGLIPEDCKVVSMNLENNHLEIEFDGNFKNYEGNDELRLLQQITWTMTEFEEVNSVSFKLDGNVLKNMPVKNTPLLEKNDRNMGINSFYLTTSSFLDSQFVLSYYEQEIDGKNYIVPFSQYVSNEDNLSVYDLTIQTLLTKPTITSRLKVVSCLDNVKMSKESILEDNTLLVSLNEEALFDETSVDKEVYDILKSSLQLCKEVNEVSFIYNEEEIYVNGIEENVTYPVSSIYFNEYYI